MNLFLIRHGESKQNIGENYCDKMPDHLVELTEKGIIQANECGKFLKSYTFKKNIDLSNATLWVSPYKRTRQTAEEINKSLNIEDIKEDITLIEQRYGLFSDTPLKECKIKYPDQFEFYDKYYQNDGKFYARMPQGESPYDVALRTRMFLETLFRDINDGKENHFIVSHGTTIRALLLSYFHYSPEWFNKEPKMDNCSVRLINNENKTAIDEGYIYGGYAKKLRKN